MVEKKIWPSFSKNYRTFYSKICHQALKNMGLGSGIRDPESGINLPRIPDPGPGVKKAPDPDPQHCYCLFLTSKIYIVIPPYQLA
jgi:hypothetical protein